LLFSEGFFVFNFTVIVSED